MNLYRVIVLAFLTTIAGAASAGAAMVSPLGGDVRISVGHGFHPITAPTEIAPGAQVMVGPGGAASIAYSATCVVSASPATVTVVAGRPACDDFPKPSYFGFSQSEEVGLSVDADAFGFTPKVGTPRASSGGVSQKSEDKADEPVFVPPPPQTQTQQQGKQLSRPPPPQETGSVPAASAQAQGGDSWDNSVLIIGGLVVGGGALAAVLLSQGGDSPASP